MQLQYDAIVVGAGPAGSTAAIRLAQADWSVALIEREVFPRRKVCGECIAASNLPLLKALGVGDAFAALAGPELRRVALLWDRESISAPLPAAPGAQPWGRALGRPRLDTLLLARARALGVTVWQPCTAHAVSGSPGAYHCELRNTRADARVRSAHDTITLSAPVAIAANGSWERLPAERAGLHAGARGHELLAFKANFMGSALSPGLLPVLAFTGGYGGMVIADEGMMTLACCIQLATLQRARRANPGLRAGEAVQAHLQEHCQGVAEALRGARRTGEWLAVGPIRPGVTPAPGGAIPPPFRIGNAAGEAHPLVGEGISMALQSAWLLCALLLGHPQVRGCGRAALEAQRIVHARYAAQWRRQFLGRMRLAAALAQLAMHPRAARGCLPLLRRAPGLLTQGARWSGKIRSMRASQRETTS
ncbi:MAG TPA: FAD-dependent monooxygenase [Steroidobacteraceae bacterium]|nr:FAD-dependent monooxygenase [Steroidobacteraceae bacterium]